jgi:signal transduction histidine kinase
VLQESLTNVVKHSAHPKARVEISYHPDEISVTVANQDLVAGSHVEGFGITGMRRRVAHLGGKLAVGPGGRPGTFEVRATIPT